MSDTLNGLVKQYTSGVENYLISKDELTLNSAYEIGRKAVIDGLGILDILTIHRTALSNVLLQKRTPEESIQIVKLASDFFAESLSPFEMTFRGYREANSTLRQLNKILEQRTVELKAVSKELEAFSYSVSHDLRTPLRSIDGFSQILLEDYADRLDEQGKDYLQRVRAASLQMALLIDDLLNLSRVTRSELHRESVDLSVLVQKIAQELQKTQPERQVDFVIAPELIANVDPRLLWIALENLLSNAWKFTEKNPRAIIEFGMTRYENREVYFVRDNGAGFDMTYADKLFIPFQRLHSITEFPGTGIGLAIVQRIIHRHGGSIRAEGKKGQGATFYFFF